MTDPHVTVLIPFYNASDLLDRCLASVAGQETDRPFSVVVADDGSTDPGVADVLSVWEGRDMWPEDTRPPWSRLSVLRSDTNRGALRNIVEAIRATPMAPDDAVLLCDGDDRLLPHAVATVQQTLGQTSNLLMYGSYLPDPPNDGCPPAAPIPEWVLLSGCVRAMAWHNGAPWNHPLAFRRCLFDALGDDFTGPDGEWMRYSYDVALMAPMIELAGIRTEFCPDPLYLYTSDRPEAVGRIHSEATAAEARWVLDRPSKYEPMTWSTW